MLKLAEKDFKATIVTMLKEVKIICSYEWKDGKSQQRNSDYKK